MKRLSLLLFVLLVTSLAQAKGNGEKKAVDLGVDAGYSGSWEKVKKDHIRVQFYNKSDKTVYLLSEVTPNEELKHWYVPSGASEVVSKKPSDAWHHKVPLIPVEAGKAIPFELGSSKKVSVVFVVLDLAELKVATDAQSLEELLHYHPATGSYKVSVHDHQTAFLSYDHTRGLYPETGTWGGWSGQTRSGLNNAKNIGANQIEILNVQGHNLKEYFPTH